MVNLHIKNNKPDGLLPAYKGLHLHTIYRNNYAFIKEQDLKLLSIKEKEPFTDDPMNEFASTGGYYFSTGKVAKKYINQPDYRIHLYGKEEVRKARKMGHINKIIKNSSS